MLSKKDLLKKLLKGIETGDPEAASVVNEDKYIQHNPQTHEGSEGLAVLFKRLSLTNPCVTFFRVFEDGDFAFAHNEYDFSSERVAFEVLRFEDDQAVEHWDNIQLKLGPNASGHTMLDGTTDITDLDKTESNRDLVHAYVERVLIKREFSALEDYVDTDLVQHNPNIADGIGALRQWLEGMQNGKPEIYNEKLHRVLAEGNFILSMCEGYRYGAHTSFYNLYRIQTGKIAEHWDTIENIAPRSVWKNENGKF